MPRTRNIFAFTGLVGSFPPYLSINETDGAYSVTLRAEPNDGEEGATVEMEMPRTVMEMMRDHLNKEFPPS